MKLKIRDERFYKTTKGILEQIKKVVDSYDMPITSRQIFYRLVSQGIITNNLNGYLKVCRIAAKGRYTGDLDWDKIVDDTRGSYKVKDWPSMSAAVKSQIDDFRVDRWENNPYYIEVFVEKRGMINTLYPTTNSLDVHLTACGGFDSTSNVWDSVRRFIAKQDEGKKIKILYFGDFDPSGDFMHEIIETRLREFGLNPEVERVCLNFEHVKNYNLPVSYEVLSKKSNGDVYDKLRADPRAQGFLKKHGQLMQVEVDALDPAVLVEFTERAIMQHLNTEDFQAALDEETQLKREWLKHIEGIN